MLDGAGLTGIRLSPAGVTACAVVPGSALLRARPARCASHSASASTSIMRCSASCASPSLAARRACTCSMPAGRRVAICSRRPRCSPMCRKGLVRPCFDGECRLQCLGILQQRLVLRMQRDHVGDLRIQRFQWQAVAAALPGGDIAAPQLVAAGVGKHHAGESSASRRVRAAGSWAGMRTAARSRIPSTSACAPGTRGVRAGSASDARGAGSAAA